jgi:hypothetical protein
VNVLLISSGDGWALTAEIDYDEGERRLCDKAPGLHGSVKSVQRGQKLAEVEALKSEARGCRWRGYRVAVSESDSCGDRLSNRLSHLRQGRERSLHGDR